MELDIQKKMVCRSGIKSEILRSDREAGSWLHGHTRAQSGGLNMIRCTDPHTGAFTSKKQHERTCPLSAGK